MSIFILFVSIGVLFEGVFSQWVSLSKCSLWKPCFQLFLTKCFAEIPVKTWKTSENWWKSTGKFLFANMAILLRSTKITLNAAYTTYHFSKLWPQFSNVWKLLKILHKIFHKISFHDELESVQCLPYNNGSN